MKEETKRYLLQLLDEKRAEVETRFKDELEPLVGYIDDLATTPVDVPAEEAPAESE